MNITPDTNIRLLKCPIKLDNKNQITFSNKEAQENYFKSLPYLEVDSSMYQRADDSIYYPDIYDNLLGYNYVMYQNTNYSNKWFYAFITDIQYENDNCTTLTIATIKKIKAAIINLFINICCPFLISSSFDAIIPLNKSIIPNIINKIGIAILKMKNTKKMM